MNQEATTALTDDAVESAVRGDPAHRAVVLAAMAPQVRGMIYARLHPSASQVHLLDDLSQEAIAAVSAGLHSLQRRTVGGLRAFASTIASRVVARALAGRGAFRQAARSLDSSVVGGDDSACGPLHTLLSMSGASPASQADQAIAIQRVLSELHALKTEHRDVITLAFFDQLETHDIAERLGISRPAASMLLIRAVKTLRRNLTGASAIGQGKSVDGAGRA
jgi:RNA polymerase sigma factor (sigma-70 family)